MQFYVAMSTKIYSDNNFSAYRRSLVFILRSLFNHKKMRALQIFIEANSLRRDIAAVHPAIYEQVTRCIFYRDSNFSERLKLITDHIAFCENKFIETAVRKIYTGNGLYVWKGDYYGEPIALELCLYDTHYREGLMGLVLRIGGNVAYTVIFWVELSKTGEPLLKIGALQGTKEGLKLNRDLTKYFFGYRPKNFMLFGLRTIAAKLGIKKIYGVSDYGYYANNHIRINRKLKTSLDAFWKETYGTVCDDHRFFELPLQEPRKVIEEVVSHKRNLYRKRFTMLDDIGIKITETIEGYMNGCESAAVRQAEDQLTKVKPQPTANILSSDMLCHDTPRQARQVHL